VQVGDEEFDEIDDQTGGKVEMWVIFADDKEAMLFKLAYGEAEVMMGESWDDSEMLRPLTLALAPVFAGPRCELDAGAVSSATIWR
jgi:hypothetical protein